MKIKFNSQKIYIQIYNSVDRSKFNNDWWKAARSTCLISSVDIFVITRACNSISIVSIDELFLESLELKILT